MHGNDIYMHAYICAGAYACIYMRMRMHWPARGGARRYNYIASYSYIYIYRLARPGALAIAIAHALRMHCACIAHACDRAVPDVEY